jgi:pimeloyl-ACP methyl ester carboxylesterase
VFENRAAKSGRTIEIHVGVIKATEPDSAPDPIIYVAGGPGGSGISAAGYAMLMLGSANKRRDLVVFDQRGTGQSNRMTCPRHLEESLGLVPFDAKMLQDLSECLAGLDNDIRAYTTAWGMDDLDDIRAGLGYEKVNLYGESYGPTAEQVYLQRHGEHVRTMVNEGSTLIDIPMFERMPRSSQQALEMLYERCQADPSCNAAYPNFSGELSGLIAQLEAEPVELSLVDSSSGQPIRLTRDWLVTSIHGMISSTPNAVLLPALIHQAYQGDWSGIENLVASSVSPGTSALPWNLMNLNILCHEDWAKTRKEETERFSEGSYLGYADVRRYLAPEEVCDLMPQPQPEARYQPLTTSPVPVLIITNQADPQNPVENSAGAKEHYPNSLQLVAPGQGHGYTGFTCRSQILADFFEKGSVEDLDASCLQAEPLPNF